MLLIVLLLLSIVFIVLATAWLKLHPFLALLLAAFGFGIAAGMPLAEVVKSVNDGFGGTIGSIGIVIIAGTIIGVFLEKTGGAFRLANAILGVTGRRNAPLGMTVMGYLISIPVFCDSGFVILSSLNKAIAKRAGISLAATSVALALGLYATHTMVPPTPGPVAAAGILGADLGLVILWGMVIGAIAATGGWLFAILVAARVKIEPYRPDEVPETAIPAIEAHAPSPAKALVPIAVPIVLIVLRSVAELPSRPLGEGGLLPVLSFLGQPVVALLIGVALALTLPRRLDREMLSTTGWVGGAVVDAAIIIVITGAGGAFGKVLQNSGVADVIGSTLASANLGIWLPFLVAAGIKTAQGSSTVAIITTAGLTAPLLPALGLDSDTARALATVAIGAGAMVVSHANDSFFWVVTQFSNMTTRDGYRLQTLGTLVQGGIAAVAVWAVGAAVL